MNRVCNRSIAFENCANCASIKLTKIKHLADEYCRSYPISATCCKALASWPHRIYACFYFWGFHRPWSSSQAVWKSIYPPSWIPLLKKSKCLNTLPLWWSSFWNWFLTFWYGSFWHSCTWSSPTPELNSNLHFLQGSLRVQPIRYYNCTTFAFSPVSPVTMLFTEASHSFRSSWSGWI